MSKSLEDRLDVAEAALQAAVGLNLSEFDPELVKARRAAVIAEALVEAQKLLDEAAKQIAAPLTVEERIDRLETIASTRFAQTL